MNGHLCSPQQFKRALRKNMIKREQIEWCQFYWYDTPVKSLPRILLIGDSIVVGYGGMVADMMKGKATVGFYSTSKIVGDPAIYRELALALADYPVDLIYFNNGLHGLDCDDDFYKKGLEDFADFLRLNTKARLLWRSSTPVTISGNPEEFDPVRNQTVLRRNRIAEEVMSKRGIPADDLYSLVKNHPEFSSKDGFHYNDEGRKAQAEHIAAYLSDALKNNAMEITVNGKFTTTYPGTVSDWCGFERHDFLLNGLKCIIVKPNVKPAKGKPWFWRARFFGAFPNADLALLKLGWHVAHIEIEELYGSPESNRRFDLLYDFMTSIGFSKKCVPVGYSRGGLDVYNWAAKNTDKVSCLYLDNPVCDFKSWPGGKGNGPGCQTSWQNCLNAWNFTEEQAMAFKGNPIDNLKPLADAKVPILHVCGDADEVVPAEENTIIVEKRYKELGGNIQVIYKPGQKHHPHCLENPQPIVDFVTRYN